MTKYYAIQPFDCQYYEHLGDYLIFFILPCLTLNNPIGITNLL